MTDASKIVENRCLQDVEQGLLGVIYAYFELMAVLRHVGTVNAYIYLVRVKQKRGKTMS